ncbi:MAG: hypothetical protein HYX63_11385 [Gammaproteobacteria bacterium]|nr:hypothetical protein [Gammaproteobacteria bacterium]
MTKLDDIIDITGTSPVAKPTHETVDFDVFGNSEPAAVAPAFTETAVLPKAPVTQHVTHEIDLDLTDESRGAPVPNPAALDLDMESADATRVVSAAGRPRTPPTVRPQPLAPPVSAVSPNDPSPLPAAPPPEKSSLGVIIGVFALLALAAAVWWLLRAR